MKLPEALDKMCELEMSVHVDFEEDFPSFDLLKAWPFWAPGGNATFEVPCSFHTYRMRSSALTFGSRYRVYEVGIQVAVAPSAVDAHLQSARAALVDEAFQDAFAARVMLGDGNSYVQNLRSENGATLARLEWPPESGNGYVGLDYTIDLYLYDQPLIGPGE